MSDSDEKQNWDKALLYAAKVKATRCGPYKLQWIRICIQEGANINTLDERGNTVLHHAVKRNEKEVIQILLEHGAKVNIKNNLGETPLELVDCNVHLKKSLISSINVPSDGHCLFWAVALAYLTPVLDRNAFLKRFEKLFGETTLEDANEFYDFTRDYNPFYKNFICNCETIRIFVTSKFRKRVVEFQSDSANCDIFASYPEVLNQSYAENMRRNSWGGDPEIEAMALLLNANIKVYSNLGIQEFPIRSNIVINECSLTLFHVNYDDDESSHIPNHFQFGLDLSIVDDKRAASVNALFQVVTTENHSPVQFDTDAKDTFTPPDVVITSKRHISIVSDTFGYETISMKGQKKRQKVCIDHGPKKYAASGLKNSMHGNVYQLKLLLLFLYRGLSQGYTFRLATEMDDAEKFDDLVLQHTNFRQDGFIFRFLQAKHSQDDKAFITYRDLITQTDGRFSLQKYFISFQKIKTNPKFKGAELKDFILCTNIDFDYHGLNSEGVVLELITELDHLLQIQCVEKEAFRYRISFPNKNHDIYAILKETSEVYQLAKKLADHILDKKKIELRVDIFKSYHIPLSRDVINVQNKTLNKKFVDGKNMSQEVTNFRNILKDMMKGRIDWCNLANRPINISSNFGNKAMVGDPSLKMTFPTDSISEDDISEFFTKLVFAVNQPNEIDLGNVIKNELGDEFNIMDSEFVTNNFLKHILDWMKEKEGRYLSEKDAKSFLNECKEKIAKIECVGLTTDYCKMIRNQGVAFAKIPNKIFKFLTTEDLQVLAIVSDDTLLGAVKVYQALQCEAVAKYFRQEDSYIFVSIDTIIRNLIRTIIAFKSQNSNNLLVIAVKSNTNDSIESLNSLSSVLISNKKKKLILILKENHCMPTWLTTSHGLQFKYEATYDTAFNFGDLTQQSQDIFLKKEIIFQGNNIELNELIQDVKRLGNLVDLSTMMKFIENDNIIIGDEVPSSSGYDKDYYIDRYFWQREIEIDLSTNDGKLDDIVVYTERDFREKCEAKGEQNIHWLDRQNDRLVWHQSYGNLSKLRKFIRRINQIDKVSECDICQKVSGNICIVSNVAGMGKSTILTSLSKAMKKKVDGRQKWICRVDLNDHTDILSQELQKKLKNYFSTGNDGVDFLLNKMLKCQHSFEKAIFLEKFGTKNGITLLFDGFDEISPDYEHIVIDLIQSLRTTAVKSIWITTRPHIKEHLENQFGVFAYTLTPFTFQDRIRFLTKFWSKHLKFIKSEENLRKLEGFATKLTQQLARSINDTEQEFTGIPLQSRMLADIYKKDAEIFVNSKNASPVIQKNLNLLQIYKSFVESKYLIYRDEKNKTMISKPGAKFDDNHLRKRFLKRYQNFAFYSLFQEKGPSLLSDKEVEKIKTEDPNDVERYGIIDKVIEKRPHFIHRTFAEYFVANLVTNLLREERQKYTAIAFIHDRVFEVGNVVLRKFIDYILAEESVPHIGALIGELGNKCHFIVDCQGRFPIHLAASYGDEKYVNNLENNLEVDKPDSLLNLTPLGYAIKASHWNVVDILLSKGLGSLKNNSVVIKDFILTKDGLNKTPLHIASSRGLVELAKALCELMDDKALIQTMSVDADGWIPMRLAAFFGHVEVTKVIVNKIRKSIAVGAILNFPEADKMLREFDVNSKDPKGNTPLHEACYGEIYDYTKEYNETIDFLLENGADPNQPSNIGFTSVHQAAYYNNPSQLELLLRNSKVQSDPLFLSDKVGIGLTPVQCAVLSGSAHTVELLLKEDVSLYSRSGTEGMLGEFNLTALHLASLLPETVTSRKKIIAILLKKDKQYQRNIIGYKTITDAEFKTSAKGLSALVKRIIDQSKGDPVMETFSSFALEKFWLKLSKLVSHALSKMSITAYDIADKLEEKEITEFYELNGCKTRSANSKFDRFIIKIFFKILKKHVIPELNRVVWDNRHDACQAFYQRPFLNNILYLAKCGKRKGCEDILLRAKSDSNLFHDLLTSTDDRGQSAIQLAILNNNTAVVNEIKAINGDNNEFFLSIQKMEDKLKPVIHLHMAIELGNLNTVKQIFANVQTSVCNLLTFEELVSYRSGWFERNALHMSCNNGNEKIVAIILEGILLVGLSNFLFTGDKDNRTAMQLAAQNCHYEVVLCLVNFLKTNLSDGFADLISMDINSAMSNVKLSKYDIDRKAKLVELLQS